MTDRSRGAPDPSESAGREAPARSADLPALYRTDALIEALAARAVAGSPPPPAPHLPHLPADPALGLLGALIADVDEGLTRPSAPVRPRLQGEADAHRSADMDLLPADVPPDHRDGDADVPQQQGGGPSRRGPRTIVALGVAGAVLATTGVAAAGGGLVETPSAAPAARSAGKPGPSREGRSAKEEKSALPHPSAGRPPGTPPTRPHKGKPGSGKPGASGTGSPSPRKTPDLEQQLKKRLEDLLHGRPQRQPAKQDDPVEETRRRLDEIRRRAEQRIDQYRDDRPHS
ncbi:hypothetical protein [Actinomadura rupiterrae]|uniref:hypothetical protein n=1 Tax=Actinomadura rupiterrae TaxID=559627 RepID=UPI0020A5DB71|nr:hypothetical protein [Actinomadura rupiterrae]MCP2335564.1 hypothetical protein [Actinomadura rupiterrae]